MKVCVVAPTTYPCPPRAYGGEMMAWLVARTLGEMGHEVHLLAPGGSQRPPGGDLHYVRGSYGALGFAYEFEAWDLYRDVILDCDVIHDWSHSAAVMEHLWLEHPHHPALMTYNGVAFTRPRFAKRNGTVASQAHLQHALHGWGAYEGVEGVEVEGENVGRLGAAEVVYWGTDTDFYTPEPEPLAPIEHPKGEIRPGYLLYIGRPHPAKGVDFLFQLADRHPEEQVVLAWRAANDDHRRWERGYLEASRDRPNLFILKLPEVGHHEAKRMLYRNAKLFLSPARYLECFGLTGVEAMACGVPAVLGSNGAGPEILDRPELGATVRAHKVEHALPDLEQALERYAEYDGQAARQAVIDRFSAPVITRAYLEVYERVLAGERW